jgi:FSR family fosmidomycin resistance protein-like MFS transporter
MDRPGLALLSVSHLAADINQGAIPVMLPYFIAAYGLSYSAAAGLMLAVTVSSSILQPILGQISDRHSTPWLVPVGLLVAGGGLALSTIMPVYLLIAVAIGFSGIGIAAFHPEAARFVNIVAGGRKATAMSVFSLGGNLGFAVGPLLGTALMLAFGLQGGLFLIVCRCSAILSL